jgi:hypothetical protein
MGVCLVACAVLLWQIREVAGRAAPLSGGSELGAH